MASRQQTRALPLLLACAALARLGAWLGSSACFAGVLARGVRGGDRLARRSLLDGLPGLDVKQMEAIMKDPKKMEEMKKMVDDIMSDPEKRKSIESYSAQMQANVEKLKDDPEMKGFFEDVQKNGLEAMAKYENDPTILRKFSQVTGGVGSVMGMPGMRGAGMPVAPTAFKPGDEVIIRGLEKAPELNGKKAMVVPPTADERKTLEGTDRLIVRLLDTGDQFAVRPVNLRTTSQEVDELMGSKLEDVSIYNPALQTEAAKLRESGKLENLQEDPELKPIFEDIKKNGMGALEKYWNDEKLMAKISKAMAQS